VHTRTAGGHNEGSRGSRHTIYRTGGLGIAPLVEPVGWTRHPYRRTRSKRRPAQPVTLSEAVTCASGVISGELNARNLCRLAHLRQPCMCEKRVRETKRPEVAHLIGLSALLDLGERRLLRRGVERWEIPRAVVILRLGYRHGEAILVDRGCGLRRFRLLPGTSGACEPRVRA
jgi:hypothetical protein